MPLVEQLLTPIPGANPGGAEIRYEPVYDKIKEARREEEDIPQGDWQTDRKVADWPLVVKLASETLEKKSKDLQIAAWLTEAKLRREGFAGLREGIDLIDGLIAQFWDHVYPPIDDGDAEIRAAPVEWVGSRIDSAVRGVPLSRAGHSLQKYKESRTVPTELEAAADASKLETRQAAITDKKLTPEEFDKGFESTPKPWYKGLVADIEATVASLDRLDARSQERFGVVAPSFSPLRAAIADVERAARQLLKRKLELDPDPVDVTAVMSAGDGAAESLGEGSSAARALSVEPTSRDDAAQRIIGAARYLRQNEPSNPAPYLLVRGFRWGELRAAGSIVDPKLLEAPTTQTRTTLKRLLLDQQWRELIEAGETVMGMAQGRGWLDLQRYVLTACDSLGSEYHFVSNAIRGELRSLLVDLPDLVDMTLMDDTPTANLETRTWLRTRVLNGDAAPPQIDAAANGSVPTSREDERGDGRPRDVRALAMAEVRGGRADRAIALLMNEVNREKTRRGRFLLQAELASIMVDTGHESVALPILEELVADIESHKLEDWEAGNLVAHPMALLYRCLTKTEGDPSTRQQLYLRICRLDPLQAMSFAQT
ncbi:MAG TPA: type VI secretion system protein TssA [Gemmatimonadaceae bacterium]|nr:type VI secretion system protein TssA [Gemmatimonadaceae bacterium]